MRETHPNRETLVEAAIELLEEHPSQHVSVDMVLKASGISRGSLYHHFPEISDLLDEAWVRRFARYIDDSIAQLQGVLLGATTKQECMEGLFGVTRATQSPAMFPIRERRVFTLAQTVSRPSFRRQLGAEQARLTAAIADVVREVQARGWVRAEIDPVVMSVFIQSYTYGKYIDDITPDHMDHDAWVALIDLFVVHTVMAPD